MSLGAGILVQMREEFYMLTVIGGLMCRSFARSRFFMVTTTTISL
jgi:hypothetical protein